MKHQSRLWCRGRREKKNGNEKRLRSLKPVRRVHMSQIFSTPVSFSSSSKHFKKWPARNKPKPGVQLASTGIRGTRHSLYLLRQALSLGLHLSSLREHNGRSQISRCASPPQARKRHRTLDEQLWQKGLPWLLKPCYLISEEGSHEWVFFLLLLKTRTQGVLASSPRSKHLELLCVCQRGCWRLHVVQREWKCEQK